MKTVKMVVAFLFDSDLRVLLIRKNRPSWQKGLLNGIGGHIEAADESIYDAAVREIKEESGLVLKPDDLTWFCHCNGRLSSGEPYKVHFFSAVNAPIKDAMSCTDELLEIHDARNLPKDTIYNLQWMIPLALDGEVGFPVEVVDLTVR